MRDKDEQDDLEFMQKPTQWPCWPILPVKQRDGNFYDKDYCGVLMNDVAEKPVVYLTNMYFISPESSLDDVPKKLYESLEKLVTEWRVD